jgi:hypothetical protein
MNRSIIRIIRQRIKLATSIFWTMRRVKSISIHEPETKRTFFLYFELLNLDHLPVIRWYGGKRIEIGRRKPDWSPTVARNRKRCAAAAAALIAYWMAVIHNNNMVVSMSGFLMPGYKIDFLNGIL